MGLAATERLHGRVQDSIGRDSVTVSTGALPAGVYWSGGLLRDADGRALVAIETLGAAASAGSYMSGGYLRDSLGRLIVAAASGVLASGQYLSGGEVRDSAGRLVMSAEALDAAASAGDYTNNGQRDAYGRRVAAGLVTSFSPSSISGLVAWWKADAITGKTDGAALSTWADSSGNGRDFTQASGGLQPLYKTAVVNGLPSVLFAGSGDYMRTASLAAQFPTAAALFIVFTPLAETNYTTYVAGAANNDEWWCFGGAGYMGTFRTGRFTAHPASAPTSGSHQWSIVSSASTWQLWQNGAAQTAQAAAFNSGTFHQVGCGLSSDGSAVDGSKGFHGYVSEVLAYNTVPSSTDRQAVESYLKSKWGTV